MTNVAENPRAVAGHNEPPPTPFEEAKQKIDDLYDEAKGWLDGEPIDSEAKCKAVSTLMGMLRKAKTAADDARKVEAEPFDVGKAEVQTRYNPLKKRADAALDTCKEAQKPWLIAEEKRNKEAAEKARAEADEKARLAREARQTAGADNLAEREKADALYDEAKAADKKAKKAENSKTQSKGLVGRATSLRMNYKPTLTDANAAAKHYWLTRRTDMEAWLLSMAAADVHRGKQKIPGFKIEEIRSVV